MSDSSDFEVEVIGRSECGLVRERNEDSLLLVDVSAKRELAPGKAHRIELGPSGAVLAVFDGMGGAASGDIASRVGREVLSTELDRREIPDRTALAEAFGTVAVRGHQEIRRFAAANRCSRGMGTTLTCCGFIGGELLLMHVGDSRAYAFRGGKLQQLTEDHSLVQELLSEGRLTQEEAADYVHSNVILQALGVNSRVYPAISVGRLQSGDLVLLCSDGLSDLVDQETIVSCLEQAELADMAESLIVAAEDRGGHDNITVLIGRVIGGEAATDDDDDEDFEMTPVRVSSAPTPPTRFPGHLLDRYLWVAAIIFVVLIAALVVWIGD
jgi:serine/threonine protein phosphatase PrpC